VAVFRTFCCLLVAVCTATCAAAKAAGPSIVFDPATGEVLSQDRAGEPWYPASLTKLMTAYIAFQDLKSGALRLEQKLPVSQTASNQPPSKIGVRPGGTVTVDFALQSLLVYSANDMAYVLAEAAAPTAAAFAARMNAEAQRLGMTGTHFVNPNGLFDPRHVSTARDMAILASALLREFPERAHYFSQAYVAVGKRKLANRNSLIRQMPEADGMKTGFVCNSGYNLAATATHEGRKLGTVILGASSGKHRTDLAEMLLVDGFARQPVSTPLKIEQIQNMTMGSLVPADLTSRLCRKKSPVEVVAATEVGGWAISFGNYATPVKADMALRGRLLSPAGLDLTGPGGVIRMPGSTGFAAIVWNLDQATGLAACARYHSQQAPCEVLTPDIFAQLAAKAAVPKRIVPAAAAPATEGGKVKKKTKKQKNQISAQ